VLVIGNLETCKASELDIFSASGVSLFSQTLGVSPMITDTTWPKQCSFKTNLFNVNKGWNEVFYMNYAHIYINWLVLVMWKASVRSRLASRPWNYVFCTTTQQEGMWWRRF